jgi:hypothetical protein
MPSASTEHVKLTVPAATDFRAVVRLVVGGIASRCGLTFEQVDDLQIAVDALLNSRTPAAESIALDASIGDELCLRIGGFLPREGRPSAHRLLNALVAETRVVELEGHEWIELALPLPTLDGTSR